MFEEAIIFLEELYFGVCMLTLVYVGLKWKSRCFLRESLLSALYAQASAWVAWYSKSDQWVRHGNLFEGTTPYTRAFMCWVCFTCLFVVFGSLCTISRSNNLSNRFKVQDILVWVCFGVIMFNFQSQYYGLMTGIDGFALVALLYVLIYAVPKVIGRIERCRAR